MSMKPALDWPLSDWLNFLENRHQQEVQLRLVNAKKVAEHMGLLDINIPVVTVTGTNGKGSTVQALEAIYQAAGYRVGCYTSPHLLRFNERIRLNQTPISDAALCDAFWQIELARQDTPLTYFETATLAALLYFQASSLDIIVLEVGVGGRLDATNIINADVAVITTVDLDHQDYLGATKEAIGYEKAGIMRANAYAVYADESPPKRVIQHAAELNVQLSCFGQSYLIETHADQWQWMRQGHMPVTLPLPNIHLKAAAAALMVSEILSARLPVKLAHWQLAMQNVKIAGRLQWHHEEGKVSILYDVAHNPQAVKLLAETIKSGQLKGRVHAVFSALKDKPIAELIDLMSSVVKYWYPALLSGKRASNEIVLTEAFREKIGYVPACYASPMAAFHAAQQQAKAGDLIVVFGSFLLVSAIMEEVLHETSPI